MMFYPIAKNNNDNNNQSSDKNDEKYLEVTESEMAKGTTAAQSWKTSSVALFRLLSTANGIAYWMDATLAISLPKVACKFGHLLSLPYFFDEKTEEPLQKRQLVQMLQLWLLPSKSPSSLPIEPNKNRRQICLCWFVWGRAKHVKANACYGMGLSVFRMAL